MSIQIKYAYRRHNTWTYRRTYPQHLRDLLGSSLKPVSYTHLTLPTTPYV